MFKAREAFAKLEGKVYASYEEFRKDLLKMRMEAGPNLPPGCGPGTLFDLGVRMGWISSIQCTISVKVQ